MRNTVELAVVIPLIVGVVEAAKRAGVPERFAPVAAIALGIVAGVLLIDPRRPEQGALLGIIAGLSAVGLWSGPRNVLGIGKDA